MIEIFQNTTPSPVDVRPILEDDVNIGITEIRKPPDELDLRRGQHRCRYQIRNLIFYNARISAHPRGVNDDLHIREIWDRVERRVSQGP